MLGNRLPKEAHEYSDWPREVTCPPPRRWYAGDGIRSGEREVKPWLKWLLLALFLLALGVIQFVPAPGAA